MKEITKNTFSSDDWNSGGRQAILQEVAPNLYTPV